MSWTKRNVLWGLGAVLIAAVVYWAPPLEVVVVEPNSRASRKGDSDPIVGQQRSDAIIPQWQLLKIKSRHVSDEMVLVFPSDLNSAAAMPITKLASPVVSQIEAPAQAPPLPFRFIGRYVEGGQTQFFLHNRGQDIVVKVGDTIEQSYKVDAMSDSSLTFTYIPLNGKQTLDIRTTP